MKTLLSRRQMLSRCSNGFGLLALQGLLSQKQILAKPHYPPKAKSVIFCYMSGGVSHVDSFDPKPALQKYAGKPMPMKVERTQFNNNGNNMIITMSNKITNNNSIFFQSVIKSPILVEKYQLY